MTAECRFCAAVILFIFYFALTLFNSNDTIFFDGKKLAGNL
jgi:hypothetical protein